MSEAEIENPTESEERVDNAVAVLKKNRELLSDIAKMRDRAAALEELGRALGGDDAVADPRAFLTKRAEESKAAEHRARVVREATLRKLVESRRTPFEGVDALVGKVLADATVTVDGDGKVVGLEKAIERAQPKKVAPGLPDVNSYRPRPTAPESFEALAGRGPEAVSLYAAQSPERYAELRADFERRLAKPERTR
jgi:hypothetical protein